MDYPRIVYAIQHNVTGRIYVGSTMNLKNRYKQHIWDLRKNKHTNKEMQFDFNEYGENYSLYVLDTIRDYKHCSIEQLWMKKLKTNNPQIGYNMNNPYFKKRSVEMRISEGVPVPNEV